MAENQIQKMSITHEMILNWLIVNPEKSQGECAKFFGVTEPWLSVIVNSDCFQARWKEKRLMLDKSADAVAQAKMRSVVDKGLERLERLVAHVPDPEFVLNTTDKILGRLGYGPKTGGAGGGITVQNTFVIDRNDLAQARQRILNTPVEVPQLPVSDSEHTSSLETSTPELLPAERRDAE